MNRLQKELLSISDKEYAAFQAKLAPTVDKSLFIGVRLPDLRAFAKEFSKRPECENFLFDLPHKYYDENLLESVLLCSIKDYDKCIEILDKYLPYVDNWAACDTIRPKCFKKHRKELLTKINEWINSPHEYECRFAIDILMSDYLDEDYNKEYLEIVSKVNRDEYYIRMMVAWYYATALAKHWDDTISYLEEKKLESWTHNKTIQKAIESYRIADEKKAYLRTLKV